MINLTITLMVSLLLYALSGSLLIYLISLL